MMNDFLLAYLGILAGLLSLLGIVGLVEWTSRIRAYLYCKGTIQETLPPDYDPSEYDPKDTPPTKPLTPQPTPEQIQAALEELEEFPDQEIT